MTNYELAKGFVKKFPHMMLALASGEDSEEFFIEEIKKLLETSNKELIDSIINRVKEL